MIAPKIPVAKTDPTISPIATEMNVSFPAGFKWAVLALLVCFSVPLYNVARFALNSDLYSYILLIPAVSVYLFSLERRSIAHTGREHRILGVVLLSLAAMVLAVLGLTLLSRSALVSQDALACSTFAFVLALSGTCAFCLDAAAFKKAIFPLVFLLFMVPFPLAMEQAIEMALQHGSAPPAYWFYKLAGTPVFKENLVFQLPGMTLQIAPECSGIRSTLVLFMTSLVAGHLFLRSPWRRAILTAAVIPLALLRNGFRVFVIGELCVQIGPHMIDSVIHHRGGPIFFALSLIPFSVLVYFLFRADRATPVTTSPVS